MKILNEMIAKAMMKASLLVLALVLTAGVQAKVVYVNAEAGATGDGSTWAMAYNDLQSALDEANEADSDVTEIWVAQGMYYPSVVPRDVTITGRSEMPIDNAFTLVKDVKIYGGFPKTGDPGMEDRVMPNLTDLTQNSVLSGDIDKDGTMANNSLNVVMSISDVGSACVDGFMICGGRAIGSDQGYDGVTYRFDGDMTVWPDDGAGVQLVNSSPALSNLIICDNEAWSGAGIFMTGCIYPGGVETTASVIPAPKLTNVLFTRNYSVAHGTALKSRDTNAIITNCTFTNNGMTAEEMADHPSDRRAVLAFDGPSSSVEPVFNNCIVYGDSRDEFSGATLVIMASITPAINHSLVYDVTEDGNDNYGKNNIEGSTDPLFTDDYKLSDNSPCINKGSNSIYNGDDKDLAGNTRIVGGTIDMGAYESQSTTSIDDVDAVKSTISSENGYLRIELEQPSFVKIYNGLGQLVTQKNITGIDNISLEKGIYIVNIDGASTKVAVK